MFSAREEDEIMKQPVPIMLAELKLKIKDPP